MDGDRLGRNCYLLWRSPRSNIAILANVNVDIVLAAEPNGVSTEIPNRRCPPPAWHRRCALLICRVQVDGYRQSALKRRLLSRIIPRSSSLLLPLFSLSHNPKIDACAHIPSEAGAGRINVDVKVTAPLAAAAVVPHPPHPLGSTLFWPVLKVASQSFLLQADLDREVYLRRRDLPLRNDTEGPHCSTTFHKSLCIANTHRF